MTIEDQVKGLCCKGELLRFHERKFNVCHLLFCLILACGLDLHRSTVNGNAALKMRGEGQEQFTPTRTDIKDMIRWLEVGFNNLHILPGHGCILDLHRGKIPSLEVTH